MQDLEKKLLDLKAYGEENEIPNISLTNARFLRDLIKLSKAKNILEIGTANGFSAINFAQELDETGKITTIEFSKNSFLVAKKNFSDFGVDNKINQILGNALDEIPKLQDNFFDFIFIDGMKRRSTDFLRLSLPKLKKGGFIILDDVIKFKEKMVGLYQFLEEQNISYNILPIDLDDGIMMIVK